MTYLSIDHVQLAIPPGAESTATDFYAGVLGFQRIEKPVPLRSNGGVWFRSGAVELHVGADLAFQPARRAHPALRVDDLDSLAGRCEAAGLMIVWDYRYPGVRRFYVDDPFGNRIEILQRPSEDARAESEASN